MKLENLVEEFIEKLAEDLIRFEKDWLNKYKEERGKEFKREYECISSSREKYAEMFKRTDKIKLMRFGEMVILDMLISINQNCGVTKVKDAIDLRMKYLGK